MLSTNGIIHTHRFIVNNFSKKILFFYMLNMNRYGDGLLCRFIFRCFLGFNGDFEGHIGSTFHRLIGVTDGDGSV